MSESPANPVIVALLFILRCLVPLAILFGISYLLRRLGFVAETPEPPSGYDEEGETPPSPTEAESKKKEGDSTHDRA